MADYLDITPTGIVVGATGHKGLKGVVFTEQEINEIRTNPRRLTKEGIKKSIENWKRSNNRHVQIKFETMLSKSEKIASSGITDEKLIIYSRNPDGTPKWIESKLNVVKELKPTIKEEIKDKNKK